MDRDRDYRRDDRREERRPREDTRTHKPRFEQGRSRSPTRHDRRDDRRRSPPARGHPQQRGPGGPPSRPDQGRETLRREPAFGGATPRGPGAKAPQRETFEGGRQNTAAPRRGPREIKTEDEKMEGGFEDEDSEAEMARVMGFKDFRTTKNTKVPGNDKNYGVHKNKKAEYRQYMNRVGGFNRPLDALA